MGKQEIQETLQSLLSDGKMSKPSENSHHFCESPPTKSIWDSAEDDPCFLRKVRVEMSYYASIIDPKNSSHEASVRFKFHVRFPKSENTAVRDLSPSIRIPSCDIEVKEARIFEDGKLSTDTTTLWTGILSMKLTGSEKFEVHEFPFDRQIIDLNLLDFRWAPGNTAMEIVDFKVRTHAKMPAWDPYVAVVKPKNAKKGKGVDDPSYAGRFNVLLKLERKPEYYIINIFLVTCGILLASLLPMAMEPSDVGDRLGVYAGGLLTLVAFKYVVAEQLPSVPYSTVALLTYKLVKNDVVKAAIITQVDDFLLVILIMIWLIAFLQLAWFKKNHRMPWDMVMANQETTGAELNGP